MNVDLTNVLLDADSLLSTWRTRYNTAEYPSKIVLNIFYRKYALESMFNSALNNKYPDLNTAFIKLSEKYQLECTSKIVYVVEQWTKSNRKGGSIKYSDFESYINSASLGNNEAIKAIEYTYKLHRIIDGLVLSWMAIVTTGSSKIQAVTRVTNAIITSMPIDNYETIEAILDQLGAENYLQSLLLKIHSNNVR